MKIKSIAEFYNSYDINSVWEKMYKDKKIILEHSYIERENESIIVKTNDQSVYLSLSMGESLILKKIQENLPEIKKIEIKMFTGEIAKKTTKQKKKEKLDIDLLKRKKIFEDIKKKYENEEDENYKTIMIAFESQAKLREYEALQEGKILCEKCREYFKQLVKEKKCILCRNREYKEKEKYIREKILNDYLINEEYVENILKFDLNIYEKTLQSILDEKLNIIYNKINLCVGTENEDVIFLENELDDYARYSVKSDDIEVLEIYKNKMKERLKKNIYKIYEKRVEIR